MLVWEMLEIRQKDARHSEAHAKLSRSSWGCRWDVLKFYPFVRKVFTGYTFMTCVHFNWTGTKMTFFEIQTSVLLGLSLNSYYNLVLMFKNEK